MRDRFQKLVTYSANAPLTFSTNYSRNWGQCSDIFGDDFYPLSAKNWRIQFLHYMVIWSKQQLNGLQSFSAKTFLKS
jgi:hypothetical protein